MVSDSAARKARIIARPAASSAPRGSGPVLPRRLRRPTLIIAGCGDVGLRLIAQRREAPNRLRIIATARSASQLEAIRAAGAIPFACDLGDRRTLKRLGPLSRWLVHLAPPPGEGRTDRHTRNLVATCARAASARALRGARSRWSYVSTTGVYGDCAGALIDETQPARPSDARALRRTDAEQTLRTWGSRTQSRTALLRAPGIYAEDRLPIERLKQGLPALIESDDVHTNHIHADDLAQASWAALWRARAGRAFNISDDTQLKMGDYFDVIADAMHLPRPPRLPRSDVAKRVSPMMLSFMQESRRLSNDRMKRELRMRLRTPDIHALLALL